MCFAVLECVHSTCKYKEYSLFTHHKINYRQYLHNVIVKINTKITDVLYHVITVVDRSFITLAKIR